MARDIKWLRALLAQNNIGDKKPIVILCDSRNAFKLMNNPIYKKAYIFITPLHQSENRTKRNKSSIICAYIYTHKDLWQMPLYYSSYIIG